MTNLERSQELFKMAMIAKKRVEHYEGIGEPEAVEIAKQNVDAYIIMYLQEFAKGMSDPPFDPKQLIL